MSLAAIWLRLAGLWAVVVAQPLLWALASSPEFFIAHRAGRAGLVAVALAVTWLPPTMLTVIAWMAGRVHARAGAALLAGLVGAHAALWAAYAASRAGAATWWIPLVAAAMAGAAAAVAWTRSPALRGFSPALALAAVAVPVLFLARPALRPILAAERGTAAAAVGARPVSAPVPVVLLVIDELSLVSLLDGDRAIDPVLYPNLAALAREGTWFRNATTVSDYTQWAVPAILTGRYPRPNALPTAADHPDSLFTMLARTHHVEGVEAITKLCPQAICRQADEPLTGRVSAMASDLRVVAGHVFLPRDVASRLLPPLTGDWAGFDKERRGGARVRLDRRQIALTFLEWIDRNDPQPAFYYLHTLLPHTPHERLPSGQRNATRSPVPGDDKWTWTSDAWGVAQHYQRHLLQIEFVDTLVGLLVTRLEEQGLYDRSLVIVSADHGIAFRPGAKRRTFTADTAGDVMRVPLIVKLPSWMPWPAALPVEMVKGQRVSDKNVETVDIVPTIADVLDLPPSSWAGASLLEAGAERPSKRIYVESARRRVNFPREGPDVAASLARKLELFGAGGNPYRVPRPARFADLVGAPVAGLDVGGGGGRVTIASRELFDRFDRFAADVPFDVAGTLERTDGAHGPSFVALAVNGTIRAVTQTWESEPTRWLATPPLDAWRDGANAIDVFVVEEGSGGPRLRRTEIGS
jgi:hypothetical protein